MECFCDGTRLFYAEKGRGDLTFLFIHNTGGDHHLYDPQIEFFSKYGRVVVPDLRGHGMSDKPKGKYTIESFAEDLYGLCKELALKNVIAVGSSMGGNIALELANRHPHLIKAAVLLDSGCFLSPAVRKRILEYKKGMHKQDIAEVLKGILEDSCLLTDTCKPQMAKAYEMVPHYVWSTAFASLLKWDKNLGVLLNSCQIPLLYIESTPGLANFKKFESAYPNLVTGKVVGSGHYPSLVVPDQINAMILQFLQINQSMIGNIPPIIYGRKSTY